MIYCIVLEALAVGIRMLRGVFDFIILGVVSSAWKQTLNPGLKLLQYLSVKYKICLRSHRTGRPGWPEQCYLVS